MLLSCSHHPSNEGDLCITTLVPASTEPRRRWQWADSQPPSSSWDGECLSPTGDGVFGKLLRRGAGAVCGAMHLMQRETRSPLSWQYGRAKQTYLLACRNSASCLTWLGVGIACYRVSAITFKSSALELALWHRMQGLLLHDPL